MQQCNAASNTCKLYGCIQYFWKDCNNFYKDTKCYTKMAQNASIPILRQNMGKFWHTIECRDFNLDAIQIWRIWLFCYPACDLCYLLLWQLFCIIKTFHSTNVKIVKTFISFLISLTKCMPISPKICIIVGLKTLFTEKTFSHWNL